MKNMVILWGVFSFFNVVIRDCAGNVTNDQYVKFDRSVTNLVSMADRNIDKNKHYDSLAVMYVYPKFNLKKDRDEKLHLNEQLFFNPELIRYGNESFVYEILNDSILVVTLVNGNQSGLSHPMWYIRDSVYFISLNDPYFIHKVDFKGKRIMGEWELFMEASKPRYYSADCTMYYITEFIPPKIILKSTTGEIDTIIVKKTVNPR